MQAGKYHFDVPQGTTIDYTIRYTSNNIPVDISGYQCRLQVRPYQGGTLVAEFATYAANGSISVTGSAAEGADGANGNLRIFMTAANCSLIPAATYKYDLELENAANVVIRLLEGTFKVSEEITQ